MWGTSPCEDRVELRRDGAFKAISPQEADWLMTTGRLQLGRQNGSPHQCCYFGRLALLKNIRMVWPGDSLGQDIGKALYSVVIKIWKVTHVIVLGAIC